MSQLVHVILPNGERVQHSFPDTATPEQILAALARIKQSFGRAESLMKKDDVFGHVVPHPDAASGWAFDHPKCVVAVGHDDNGEFVEDRRIKG